jgi:hypothetical protein
VTGGDEFSTDRSVVAVASFVRAEFDGLLHLDITARGADAPALVLFPDCPRSHAYVLDYCVNCGATRPGSGLDDKETAE